MAKEHYRTVNMRILVGTDSCSFLLALKNKFVNNAVLLDIVNTLNTIRFRGMFEKFLWIQEHTNIERNDRADELARQAADSLLDPASPFHIKDLKYVCTSSKTILTVKTYS